METFLQTTHLSLCQNFTSFVKHKQGINRSFRIMLDKINICFTFECCFKELSGNCGLCMCPFILQDYQMSYNRLTSRTKPNVNQPCQHKQTLCQSCFHLDKTKIRISSKQLKYQIEEMITCYRKEILSV